MRAALLLRRSRPGSRTSFHHQPEAQHPKSSAIHKLPADYDIQRDIDPAAGVVSYPMIMVAHPSVPAKSVAELIAHAKANPGKVTNTPANAVS